MDPRPLRIFFSHAHEDNELCRTLVDRLQRDIPLTDPEAIFIDVHHIHPGDQFMRTIQRNLVERPIFIVALTPRSVKSSFVSSEVDFAIAATIKTPQERKIISLLLEPCDPTELAPFLGQFQFIDFTHDAEKAFQSLVTVLRGWQTGHAAPEPPASVTALPFLPSVDLTKARQLRDGAQADLAAQRWERARVKAEEGREIEGFANDVTFRKFLAQAFVGEGKWLRAEEILDDLLNDALFDPELWGLQARVQQASEHYEDAISAIDRALRYEMDDAKRDELLLLKCRLQLDVHDDEGALKTWRENEATLFKQPSHAVYQQIIDRLPTERALSEMNRFMRLRGVTLDDWLFFGSKQPDIVEREKAFDQITRRYPDQVASDLRKKLRLLEHLALPWTEDAVGAKTVERLQSLGFSQQQTGDIVYFEPPMRRIEAGPFMMGSDILKDGQAFGEEEEQHQVNLVRPFLMGTYPVTVAEYATFVRMADHSLPRPQKRLIPGNRMVEVTWQDQLAHLDYPVVCIEWEQAMAYTRWLARVSGKRWRLPTEAEWEKAARWDPQRNIAHIYPWNDHWDAKRCNTRDGGPGHVTPIDAYPRGISPWGVMDMAGNVWEWTTSIFQPYPYTDNLKERENIDKRDQLRVLRGGAWLLKPRVARAACRNDDNQAHFVGYFFDVGFRLVCDIDEETSATNAR